MASKFFKEVVTWGIKKLPRSKKVSETITKVAPTVGKELSESARGLRLAGWAKRMRQKLKKD